MFVLREKSREKRNNKSFRETRTEQKRFDRNFSILKRIRVARDSTGREKCSGRFFSVEFLKEKNKDGFIISTFCALSEISPLQIKLPATVNRNNLVDISPPNLLKVFFY